jgi:O-methyltransferase
MLKIIKKLIKKHTGKMRCDYQADMLGVRNHSLEFMHTEKFETAWSLASEAAKKGWGEDVPDIRWRVHVAIWAAQNGLNIEGDFVECGVHTGILSLAICDHLDFAKVDKKFWLFDTWSGIPLDGLSEADKEYADNKNKHIYTSDIFLDVQETFKPYEGCKFVRGILPDSFGDAEIHKISYLSIDLNNTLAEEQSINVLWPKLSKGAFVVLDDYGWTACKDQRDMWNNFATSKGQMIVTLPTGQGLLIKN